MQTHGAGPIWSQHPAAPAIVHTGLLRTGPRMAYHAQVTFPVGATRGAVAEGDLHFTIPLQGHTPAIAAVGG